MRSARVLVGMALLICAHALWGQSAANEKAVWKLEHRYWENVKALDLTSYRALWHEDFVGWPYVSARPVRKDHITDWIATFTSKGQRLKQFELEPADSQAIGEIVVTYYWMTADWVDKAGKETRAKSRITHTWIDTATGWQIVGGMSAGMPN